MTQCFSANYQAPSRTQITRGEPAPPIAEPRINSETYRRLRPGRSGLESYHPSAKLEGDQACCQRLVLLLPDMDTNTPYPLGKQENSGASDPYPNSPCRNSGSSCHRNKQTGEFFAVSPSICQSTSSTFQFTVTIFHTLAYKIINSLYLTQPFVSFVVSRAESHNRTIRLSYRDSVEEIFSSWSDFDGSCRSSVVCGGKITERSNS